MGCFSPVRAGLGPDVSATERQRPKSHTFRKEERKKKEERRKKERRARHNV